jgi:16S rRNA G966 N2-methylase RsmD
MNKETKQYIAKHEQDDIYTLCLENRNEKNVDYELAIRQIKGRQKIKTKVPLFYNTCDIVYPAQLSLEQSSSETTAKYKASLCKGEMLTDLTGGFGVDCCFMSSNFNHVHYVEKQDELCKIARNNFDVLNKKHIVVHCSDAEEFLNRMQPVDWIYIDPARRNKSGQKMVSLDDCEPNISRISTQLLEKAKNVMIKLSPMLDISVATHDLTCIEEIHIVAVENECKELILILNADNKPQPILKTVHFSKNKPVEEFEFVLSDETDAHCSFTTSIKNYLYEPNVAVLKSGAFKLIGSKFNLQKLHKNTHLYTSDQLISDFPGRIFIVSKVWQNSKKELKKLCEKTPNANISTRNYPIGSEELRKKLKLKDGGSIYLFACTLANEEKCIVECRKI